MLRLARIVLAVIVGLLTLVATAAGGDLTAVDRLEALSAPALALVGANNCPAAALENAAADPAALQNDWALATTDRKRLSRQLRLLRALRRAEERHQRRLLTAAERAQVSARSLWSADYVMPPFEMTPASPETRMLRRLAAAAYGSAAAVPSTASGPPHVPGQFTEQRWIGGGGGGGGGGRVIRIR